MKRRNAFTLVQLLVVVAVVMVSVLAVVVWMTSRRWVGGRESDRRALCRANIHTIVAAMREYSTDDQGKLFPSAFPTVGGINAIGIGRDRKEIAGNAGASRSLFLLIRNDYVGFKAFLCPSAVSYVGHEVDETVDIDTEYDFPSHKNLSYSYQVQKRGPAGEAGHPTTIMDSSDLAVYADRSPVSGEDGWRASGGGYVATPDLARVGQNSFNHDQAGQNVGFADASVRWETTPQVGPVDATSKKPDNIWVTEDTATGGDGGVDPIYPTSDMDSVLWP